MPDAVAKKPGLLRATLGRLFGRAAQSPAPVVAEQRTAAPRGRQQRMYAGARNSRLTVGFGSAGNTSADAELETSLTSLRSRSRQMVRDSAYAKRARVVVVNNVVGAGIGLQAQVMTNRGTLNERVNTDIERVFSAWKCADACHTGGALHFHDLERMAMAQVFDAGEVLIRVHLRRFGGSEVPLALEVVEPERLADQLSDPAAQALIPASHHVRLGVEVDEYMRAHAYWIRKRHPGDVRIHGMANDYFERVPAAEVFHLRIIDRWPQTRGEPWMHTVLRKIDDMNEYSGSEVQAARAAAYYFATIETEDADDVNPLADEAPESDQDENLIGIEPLTVQKLNDGERLNFHKPDRPNVNIDPFLRYMLREVSAGLGPSYESISRDYSQSNYSSSRLALLDDRDLWKVLQAWWIRSFRVPLHKLWMQQAVLAGAIPSVPVTAYAPDVAKFESALFKPRGWSWVDPTKEVKAAKEAVMAGFTTVTDVIAQTAGGLDIEDVLKTRQRELVMFAEAEVLVDTTVQPPGSAASAKPGEPAEPVDPDENADDDDPPDSAAPPGGSAAGKTRQPHNGPQQRVVSLAR